MNFESSIERSNTYYKKNGLAKLRKIPTPVQVYRTEKGRIVSASYKAKSALDFNGVIKGGTHIDFDTKETKIKTRFPFANAGDHQFRYMREIDKLGGAAFFLVNFTQHDEVYVLRIEDIDLYLKENKGKKSMHYGYFEEELQDNLVEKKRFGNIMMWDYLTTVKELYNI